MFSLSNSQKQKLKMYLEHPRGAKWMVRVILAPLRWCWYNELYTKSTNNLQDFFKTPPPRGSSNKKHTASPIWRLLWPTTTESYRWGFPLPIGSMYGIFTYIWLIFMVNVAKYTIHGSYGLRHAWLRKDLCLTLHVWFFMGNIGDETSRNSRNFFGPAICCANHQIMSKCYLTVFCLCHID